jgi:hypothetical protein
MGDVVVYNTAMPIKAIKRYRLPNCNVIIRDVSDMGAGASAEGI